MPELPEVTTTVEGLRKTVIGKTVKAVWADWPRLIREHSIPAFGRRLKGARILHARRRGKNIFIDLSNGDTLHVHMKMTGHLLFGNWQLETRNWKPATPGPLQDDPFNRHIRMVIMFTDGTQLALSDLRRFAKVGLFKTGAEHERKEFRDLGPEALDITFSMFAKRIQKKTTRPIKQVLLDQRAIAGIGNIYSDEMLFRAGIHPLSVGAKIPVRSLRLLFNAMKTVLKAGIDFGGDSMSDYRNVYGEKGKFQEKHLAYRRTGKPCTQKGCRGTIARKKIGGRSAHFCPTHQVLYT